MDLDFQEEDRPVEVRNKDILDLKVLCGVLGELVYASAVVDVDLQEEDGQAGEDEHEEVGDEEGAAAVLEAEERKPPNVACIQTIKLLKQISFAIER